MYFSEPAVSQIFTCKRVGGRENVRERGRGGREGERGEERRREESMRGRREGVKRANSFPSPTKLVWN